MRIILIIFLLLINLSAHNLQHKVLKEEATILEFSFASDDDFSFQSYEIYAPNKDKPYQVGRTDVHSKILFLPDTQGRWKIKLFSEDGHGKIVDVEVKSLHKITKTSSSSDNSMAFLKGLAGILILFMIFTVIYKMKKEKNEKNIDSK